MINSLFGLLVPIAADMGLYWLIAVRFIQGLGEVSKPTEQVQSEMLVFAHVDFFGQKFSWFSLSYLVMVFKCTFLVRALLYHARTLFWQSGSHPMNEVEWVLSYTQV